MDNGHCNTSRGSLIILELLDHCGKTSQSSRLVTYLEGKGFSVESWWFPDRSTSVGEMISSYLASKEHLDDQAVHLLFSANCSEKKGICSDFWAHSKDNKRLVTDSQLIFGRLLMESKLKSRTTLIVDCYAYSRVAFSAAKGLDIDWCKVKVHQNAI